MTVSTNAAVKTDPPPAPVPAHVTIQVSFDDLIGDFSQLVDHLQATQAGLAQCSDFFTKLQNDEMVAQENSYSGKSGQDLTDLQTKWQPILTIFNETTSTENSGLQGISNSEQTILGDLGSIVEAYNQLRSGLFLN